MFKVTATEKGYYANAIIAEGQDFKINEVTDFSHNWMSTEDENLLKALEEAEESSGQPDISLDAEAAAEEIALLENQVGELTTINEEAEGVIDGLKKQLEEAQS